MGCLPGFWNYLHLLQFRWVSASPGSHYHLPLPFCRGTACSGVLVIYLHLVIFCLFLPPPRANYCCTGIPACRCSGTCLPMRAVALTSKHLPFLPAVLPVPLISATAFSYHRSPAISWEDACRCCLRRTITRVAVHLHCRACLPGLPAWVFCCRSCLGACVHLQTCHRPPIPPVGYLYHYLGDSRYWGLGSACLFVTYSLFSGAISWVTPFSCHLLPPSVGIATRPACSCVCIQQHTWEEISRQGGLFWE